MPVLKTTDDLALTIRQRRKALGWDQAGLAERTGVSRQWVIDIEKGKARAELHLVLRVMNVLGLRLSVDAPAPNPSPSSQQAPSMDEVLASHRGSSSRAPVTENAPRHANRSTGSRVDFMRIMEEVEQELDYASRQQLASKRDQPPPSGERKK